MPGRSNTVAWLRSLIYYIGFYPVTILYSLPCLLIGPMLPFRIRFRMFTGVNYFYMAWLKLACGLGLSLQGREHLPRDQAYVVVSNHQSEWETFYLQVLVRPQVVVLKRELLKIPFFGWALGMLNPIALDRSARRGALKQLLSQGKARLGEGIPVVIFPQGTRVPAGQLGRMNKGGAMLAVSNGVPLVPMVHNAGLFWPGKGFVKQSGTVQVRVGEPISVEGRSVEEVHQIAAEWMEQNMREIGAL